MGNYVNVDFELVKALKNNFEDLNIGFEDVALLSLIMSLSNNDKHCCYASNPMLADAFQTSERNIRKKLLKLESAGLIKRYSESEKGSFITKNRYIYPQFTIINDILSEFQKGGTIVPQYEEGGTIIPKRRNNRSTIAEQMDHDSGTIVPTNNKDIKDNKYIRRKISSALTDSGTKVPLNNIEVSTDTIKEKIKYYHELGYKPDEISQLVNIDIKFINQFINKPKSTPLYYANDDTFYENNANDDCIPF